MALTRRQAEKAIQQRKAWMDAGVPTVITAGEAHRLTGGKAGKPGDHSTPISLAAVAVATVRKAG